MTDSAINKINEAGTYVGTTIDRSDLSSFVYRGFIGSGGTITRLDYPGRQVTYAMDITDDGWIAGLWQPTPGQERGYVAHGSEFFDLGVFPGSVNTYMGAINNDRTVVGAARGPTGSYITALIWPNGSLVPQDLNLLVNIPGVTLIRGMDVNDAGQILAVGRFATGAAAYYVLTPVPEPAFASLLCVTFSLLTRRRDRQVA